MKPLLSLIAVMMFLPALAGAKERYSCSVTGPMTGTLTMTIELLSDTSANLIETPALVRISNPSLLEVDARTGYLKITSDISAGPTPNDPVIRTGKGVFYFDKANLRLIITKPTDPTHSASIPCTQI